MGWIIWVGSGLISAAILIYHLSKDRDVEVIDIILLTLLGSIAGLMLALVVLVTGIGIKIDKLCKYTIKNFFKKVVIPKRFS